MNVNINNANKRKYNDEDDYERDEDEFFQPEPSSPPPEAGEFDSFITDETDYTYQTEDSDNYAETLKTRIYIMTLQEVDICEANKKRRAYI
ncbi:hypothetical protein PS15p_210624 [Mucor circinelloides]